MSFHAGLESSLITGISGCLSPGPRIFRLRDIAAHHFLIHSSPQALSVGRFELSSMTRQTDCGQYAVSLSIRSGRGTNTHDRVFRFTPLFRTAQAAERYAFDQGLHYLSQPTLLA